MKRSHCSVPRLALCAAAFCGGVVLMVLVAGTGIRLRTPSWLVDCAVALALLFTVYCMTTLRGRRDDAGKDLTPPPAKRTTRPAWIGHLLLVLVALLAADAMRSSLKDIVGVRGEDAQAYFERGNALAAAGKYAEACEHYAKAVGLNPGHSKAYLAWGYALQRLGTHADACEKFAKAVEIAPRLAEAHLCWGLSLVQMGKPAEACHKCAKAVEANPQYAEAYLLWGEVLVHVGKRAEAEEKWSKAVELNPALKPQIEEMRKKLLGKE